MFGAAASHTPGLPSALAVADFNHDGRPDVVVCEVGSGTVSIQFGKGDGRFWPAIPIFNADQPYTVVAADFNGDGNADLAIGDENNTTVQILLGNGDGTFELGQSIELSDTFRIRVLDYNADGIEDLAVTPVAAGTVSLVPGNGDGTFGQPETLNVGFPVSDVKVGDFNGDGVPDLFLGNWTDPAIEIELASSPGVFGSPTVVPVDFAPEAIALVSDPETGFLDVLVDDFRPLWPRGELQVFKGNGDGTISGEESYVLRSHSADLITADLDGDGIQDLVMNNIYDDTVTVMFGTPTGTYGRNTAYRVGDFPLGMGVADLNQDGKPDIVTAGAYTGELVTQINEGGGEFPSVAEYLGDTYPPGGPDSNPVDINGDGYPDLVAVRPLEGSCGSIDTFINDGTGSLTSGPASQLDCSVFADQSVPVVLRDMNGDGRADAVIAASQNGESAIEVAYGNGDGTFSNPQWTASTSYDPYTGSHVVDLDGDGRPDIVEEKVPDSFAVYRQQADGTFQYVGDFGPYETYTGMAIADLNGDGAPDVLMAANFASEIVVVPGQPGGGFGNPITYPLTIYSAGIAAADLDHDGKPDIVVTAPNGVQVLRNLGDFNFSTPVVYPMDAPCEKVSIADLNSDGNNDVLCGSPDADLVMVAYGNGDATLGNIHAYAGAVAPLNVYAADMNDDGLEDMVVRMQFWYLGVISPPANYPRSTGIFFQRPPNRPLPPVTKSGWYYTNMQVPVETPISAHDESGTPISLQIVSPPSHGTAELSGQFLTYDPAYHFYGWDSIGIVATSPNGTSNESLITVQTFDTDQPPVANPVELVVTENTPETGSFDASDPNGDSLTFYAQEPLHGTVEVTDNPPQSFVYTPDAGYTGSDIFGYSACDWDQQCGYSSVSISVYSPNPPVAGTLDLTTGEEQPVSDQLPGSDPDGGTLTFAIDTAPEHGTAVIHDVNSGSFTYTPDNGFSGDDNFTYTVSDDHASAQGSVVIHVIPFAPQISNIPDQVVTHGGSIGPFPFTVSGSGALTVTALSTNTSMVDSSGISISSGCGTSSHNCTITLSVSANPVGHTMIRITAEDAYGQTGTDEFEVKADSTSTGGSTGGGGGGGASNLFVLALLAFWAAVGGLLKRSISGPSNRRC